MSATKEHHHDEIEAGMRKTGLAIHLLDAVNGQRMAPQYLTMRCGIVQPPWKVKITTNPAEVTCIKCRSYINNPWRVLRKYGKVKVVESFFVMLWADYGYPFDVVATIDTPGLWTVVVSKKGQMHFANIMPAKNMADLGFLLVKIVEKEIAVTRNFKL